MADTLFGLPSKSPKLPSGIASAKPSLWEIVDGVLGGNTVTDSIYKAKARQAALADADRKSALQDQIMKLITGADDEPTAAAPATPKPAPSTVDVLSADVGDNSAPTMPTLPSQRRFNPDRLNRILAAAAYGGDEGAGKAAEVINKLKPDLDKGLYADGQGRVHVRDGYTDASRALSGATTAGSEAAKADYDVIDVDLPDGSKAQMPRSLFIQLRGKIPGLGTSQTPGAKVTQEEGAKAPFDVIEVPQSDGSTVKMSRADFLAQRPGGAAVAAGPRVGVSQTPADATYAESAAKAAAERYKGYQDAGDKAPVLIGKYRQIDNLLGDLEGGRLTPAGLEVASALNSLGFKVDPKLGNTQAADALTKQVTLDALGGGLGAQISDSDRRYINSTQPTLEDSAKGRRIKIQMGIKLLERQQSVAQKARQWQQRFGRIDTPDSTGKTFDDYLQAWSSKNPVFPQGAR